MILCGDFAYPFRRNNFDKIHAPNSFLDAKKIVNFESTLRSLNGQVETRGIPLQSEPSGLHFLKNLNTVGVCCANNHLFDYRYALTEFRSAFANEGIATFGFGRNLNEASREFVHDDFVFLNFGWKVIGCEPAGLYSQGVNPLEVDHVKDLTTSVLEKHPEKRVYVIAHWNYEFELYPQPLHRELSKDLISLGVEGVIGHHPHLIQGAEIFRGKLIAYSLGNFYLPVGKHDAYSLAYRNRGAFQGLCLDVSSTTPLGYVVELSDDKLNVREPEPILNIPEVKRYSEFQGLDDDTYLSFFKENRKKRKLLPVFKSSDATLKLKESWVKVRQLGIEALVRSKVKQ